MTSKLGRLRTPVVVGTVLALLLASSALAAKPTQPLLLHVINTATNLTTLTGNFATQVFRVNNDHSDGTAVGATNNSATEAAIEASNAGGGPALDLSVTAGQPPMKVDSSGKVDNLNADQLDGRDSTSFQAATTSNCQPGEYVASISPNGTVTCASDQKGLSGVTAGTGLASDGHTTNPTLSVADQGVDTAQLKDGAVTTAKLDPNIQTPNADKLDGKDSTDFQGSYQRTVVVSPVGTAAENGVALLDALARIPTPSESAPWLLKIEPGTYDLGTSPLVLKPFLHVEGSGEDATIIKGAGSASATTGTIVGNRSTELRFLTVQNYGIEGTGYAIGIYNDTVVGYLSDVTVKASGAYYSYGIYNTDSSSLGITDVLVTAEGSSAYGIYNEEFWGVLTNVIVTVNGSNTVGIFNNLGSSPIMTNITVNAIGRNNNRGVENQSSSSPVMTNVIVTVYGGSGGQVGVRNVSSSPVMRTIRVSVSQGRNNSGVSNSTSSSPQMTDVVAIAQTAAERNCGVCNLSSSSPTMINVTASGTGGQNSYGVRNHTSSPTMRNVVATGTGGSTGNYGVFDEDSASTIENSRLEGTTSSIAESTTSGTTKVANTQLVGGAPSTGITCFNNYDENFTAVTCP